jgi:hypothetical protein
VGANLGIGQTNQPSGPALAAIFFGLRRVLRPADRAGLRVADGLGQHLAQLSLGLGWCPRDRCLPVSHDRYVGMPERELNPAGDLKNRRSSDGLPKDNLPPPAGLRSGIAPCPQSAPIPEVSSDTGSDLMGL